MTKKLIAMVVLLFAATITLEAQEIKWMTFDQAIAAQKKKPKKMYTPAGVALVRCCLTTLLLTKI